MLRAPMRLYRIAVFALMMGCGSSEPSDPAPCAPSDDGGTTEDSVTADTGLVDSGATETTSSIDSTALDTTIADTTVADTIVADTSGGDTSSADAADAAPAPLRITVLPLALRVAASESVTATVTIDKVGLSGAAALTATTVDGLTVTFTPSSVDTTGTITVAAAATAALGPRTVKLKASLGTASAEADLQVVVEPSPILGRVLDRNGRAMVGATVIVKGRPAVTAGAWGEFRVDGVVPPYDVSVVYGIRGTSYPGVQRRNPVLQLVGNDGWVQQRFVSGPVTGLTLGSGETLVGAVGSSANASLAASETSSGSDTFLSARLAYLGTTTPTATLHALRLQPGVDVPTIPIAYGSSGPRSVFSEFPMTMAPVASASVAGTVTPLAGAITDAWVGAAANFGGGARILLGTSVAAAPAFKFALPTGVGATADLMVAALTDNGRSYTLKKGIAPGSSAITINSLPVPTPTSPAAGATGIKAGSTFSWTGVPGAVYAVVIGGYVVFTTSTSISLPDFVAIGAAPSSVAMSLWSVFAYEASSVDALLAAPVMLEAEAIPPQNWGTTAGRWSVSTGRPITLAP